MSKRGIENSIRMFVAGAIVAGTVGCANATPNPDKETYTPTPITSPSNTIIPPFDETPTVETQNWTETVIATAIPTETATLSPAEIPIDRDLLYNFPTSYQDLLTRPEGCVMAPDPLEDLDVFNQWKRDKLVPLFGDLMTREPNVSFDVPVYGGINPMYGISLVQFSDIDSSTLISGEQAIFCFKHDGFLYPVVMWTVGNHGGHNYGTFGLILFNGNIGGLNESGVDIIRLLSERETRIAAIDILKGPSSEYLPDVINEMLDLEMTAYIERLPLDTPDIDIGPAIIQLQP